jgi:hypothetical protein
MKLKHSLERICLSAAIVTATIATFFNLSASARTIEGNQREMKTLSLVPNLELAQSTGENSTEEAVTPFALVSLAEEGRFKEQGIPGAGSLRTSYRVGKVTAESLVKVAIDNNLIPPQTLQDEDYLNDVSLQLRQRLSN